MKEAIASAKDETAWEFTIQIRISRDDSGGFLAEATYALERNTPDLYTAESSDTEEHAIASVLEAVAEFVRGDEG